MDFVALKERKKREVEAPVKTRPSQLAGKKMRTVMFKPQRSNPIFLYPPPPDLAGVLSRCGAVAAVKQAHALALTGGAAPYLHNHLLSKLTLLADLPYAALLFSHLPSPSDFSYNVMIRALATTWRRPRSSLLLYFRMKAAGVRPNNFTFPFVFIACGDLRCFSCGEMAQSMIFRSGLDRDGHCVHSLISCYSKCGELGIARKVFDEIAGRDRDVVSWSSMISGYSRMGFAREAVEMFRGMRVAGFKPNEMTLVSVLGACGDLGDLEMGRWIEGFVEASGMVVNSYIGSSLIDMYGKCGDLQSARQVFDRSGKKDMVVWNAMITGYAQNGLADEAIKLFHNMKNEGIQPNKITMVGVLPACAAVGALELGVSIDKYASQNGLRHDIYVGTALIDMYAKCGSIELALSLFEDMPKKNIVSWNAMITALATHGRAQEAITLFRRMIEAGDVMIQPNDITFIGVLSACVHAGLVGEGCHLFESMLPTYGITPKMEHYSCMVDLLARAGQLNEAYAFLETMPEKPDAVTLGALLCACRSFKNIDVGEKIIVRILELEPSNSGNYVISSKMFAGSERWEDSARMRGLMKERGVTKTPGCSWIEIDYLVHEFHSGDDLHPKSRDIYEIIALLVDDLKMEGYIPMVDCGR